MSSNLTPSAKLLLEHFFTQAILSHTMNNDDQEEQNLLLEYQSPTLTVLEIKEDTNSGAMQIHETNGGSAGLFS